MIVLVAHPTGGSPVTIDALPADLRALNPDLRLQQRLRLAVITLGGLVLAPLVAAILVPIDGAVVAGGTLNVAAGAQRVSHPAGGVIAWIGVTEGQHVKRGQLLLRLDDQVSSAGASLSSLSIYQLLAQRSRLEAERVEAASVRFDPDMLASADPRARKAMADEAELFDLRRRDAASMATQLRARISGYQRQIVGYHQQIAALNRQALLIGQEGEAIESLYKRGLVTLSRRNELARGVAGVDGSIADLMARVGQAEAMVTEARAQLLQLGATRRSEAATQLAQVNSDLNQQQMRRVTAGDLQSRTEIVAAFDGVVGKLSYTSVGDVLRPADPILELVPDGHNFVVQAEIAPTDIDQVTVGQPARVRLSALNQAMTPELAGEVVAISPDRTVDPRTERPYYKVRVRISDPAIARVKLTSGMPAEVFVQTSRRSLLSLLTKPLRDQFTRAFRH